MPTPITGQIRVGLIGAGLIGQLHSMMLRYVADRTEQSVRVVSVADLSHAAAENLAARWQGARALESAEEIIADPSIDAVWICTPTAMHRKVCIAAAEAGKHIFCEKPLAMTAAEASAMAAAIKASGVISQVGLVLRFSPVYNVIKTMFEAPDAGRLLSVTMRDDQDFPTRGAHASAWRNDPSLTAGGTLIEHSVHDFDLLTWMFGPVTSLYCRTRNLNGADGVEDFGATSMEFAGGWHGQLTSIWHRMIARASNRRLEVFAENLFVALRRRYARTDRFSARIRRERRDDHCRRSDGEIHRKNSARAAVPRADQGSPDDPVRRRGCDICRRAQGRVRSRSRICGRRSGAANSRGGL